MKQYLSIPGPSKAPHQDCYVFLKYDGSNIRCEWSKKRGWYKFGTRNCLLDMNDLVFGRAAQLFLDKYGDALEQVFKIEKLFRSGDNVTVFFEFLGSKTFAGMHQPNDNYDVVLFDVNPYKKGLLGPKEFIDIFGHLQVSELVGQYKLGPEFIENIRQENINLESSYNVRNEVPEGVVCKGGSGHHLWMCKIKTNRYKQQLQELYQADWLKFWE